MHFATLVGRLEKLGLPFHDTVLFRRPAERAIPESGNFGVDFSGALETQEG